MILPPAVDRNARAARRAERAAGVAMVFAELGESQLQQLAAADYHQRLEAARAAALGVSPRRYRDMMATALQLWLRRPVLRWVPVAVAVWLFRGRAARRHVARVVQRMLAPWPEEDRG